MGSYLSNCENMSAINITEMKTTDFLKKLFFYCLHVENNLSMAKLSASIFFACQRRIHEEETPTDIFAGERLHEWAEAALLGSHKG